MTKQRIIDLIKIKKEIQDSVDLLALESLEKKVESDHILTAVTNQPKQFQCVLYSILLIIPQKKNFYTGEIYEIYKDICRKCKFNVLTQRRISDVLAELDMLGVINAKIISKGRYGRTREISISLDENLLMKLKELLEKSLNLSS